MLKFRMTMDPCSREVVRCQGEQEQPLGNILWRDRKEFVIYADIMERVTLDEMKQIVEELETH